MEQEKINIGETGISRRRLLKMGLVAAAASVVPYNAFAATNRIQGNDRRLCIYNLHTKEHLDIVFRKNGKYIKDALNELNHIFRDHYNGAIRPIKRELLELLCDIQEKTDCDEPFHLISGYRSRSTNAMLKKQGKGVANKSLHMRGMAADIRIPNLNLKNIRKAAYELRRGGVGFYPRSNFVHLDVGQIRFWRG